MSLAVVLGGGGIAGIAWHTGVLLGLAESGADVTSADLFIGTSAGSTVAAQVGGGLALDELFRRQVDPASLATEIAPPVSMAALVEKLTPMFSSGLDDAERRRHLGEMALATETVDEGVRRQVIAARLAGLDWSERRVEVVVVDSATGDRRVLDRTSGVGLVDAVAASSAVPGVWPPVTIGGARYIDGGIWSLTNADLAGGHDQVLVLAPIVDSSVEAEMAGLGAGARVELVSPDEASLHAFGIDVLDPVVKEPSARAGLIQGRAESERIGALLAR